MGSRAPTIRKGTHHTTGFLTKGKREMDCVSAKMEPARARSEERHGASGSVGRRPSLPAHNQARPAAAWPAHYSTTRDRKTSESLERLTSRTLSPAPETLPRKFSRTHGNSVLPNHSHPQSAPRLPRHPELPPLNSSSPSGPRLEEYLEKPRLVSTAGRKSSSTGDDATDALSQQLVVQLLQPDLPELLFH